MTDERLPPKLPGQLELEECIRLAETEGEGKQSATSSPASPPDDDLSPFQRQVLRRMASSDS